MKTISIKPVETTPTFQPFQITFEISDVREARLLYWALCSNHLKGTLEETYGKFSDSVSVAVSDELRCDPEPILNELKRQGFTL